MFSMDDVFLMKTSFFTSAFTTSTNKPIDGPKFFAGGVVLPAWEADDIIPVS